MFSVNQKRDIAEKIQQILRATGHPELPSEEIQFSLHVQGRYSWSWADIRNKGAIDKPDVNPWNEAQTAAAPKPACEAPPPYDYIFPPGECSNPACGCHAENKIREQERRTLAASVPPPRS